MGAGRIAIVASLICLAAGTPVDASPVRGRIVYASDGSIFVSSADRAQRWRLTTSDSDLAPAWSPDGTAVAFLRMEDHGSDLYVVSVSGDREMKLASDVDEGFAWSPDGETIAFSSAGADLLGRTSHLYTVDVASGLVTRLTRGRRSDTQPTWSPGGTVVLFVRSASSLPGSDPPGADIYSLRVAGGSPMRLTESDGADYAAEWSPDGTRIVFISTRNSPAHAAEPAPELYVMDAEGRRETRLTFSRDAHDIAPRWSPDGRRIAFLRLQGDAGEGRGSIRVLTPDGGGRRILTVADDVMTWDPSWAPDSKAVVFVASRVREDGGRSDTEIALRALDSSRLRFLTENDRFEWGPDWL